MTAATRLADLRAALARTHPATADYAEIESALEHIAEERAAEACGDYLSDRGADDLAERRAGGAW